MGLSEDQEAALAEAREQAAEEGTVSPLRPGTDMVPHATLTVTPAQSQWTEVQLAALAAIGLGDVPEGDRQAFLHLCQRSELDPFAREIYLIGRKDRSAPSGMKYTAQTGIDGYRHIAQRTGQYEGREGPWWCGKDGVWREVWLDDDTPPSAAKVRIFRRGAAQFEAIALYREFVPMEGIWRNQQRVGEQPTMMWRKMPAHMLAKCAEALAIRQAFPREASGIYVTEEMGVADAHARDESRQQVEQERARQRAELARFPDPGEPASPKDTAPGDVVEGEVVTNVLNRDALWTEVETQAEVLGQSVAAMSSRWAVANRKNLTDATAQELLTFIEANRHRVEEKVRTVEEELAKRKVEEAVTEVADTTELPDDVANEPSEMPLVSPDIDPDEPHPYQDWSGKCVVCMQPESDERHTP